MRAILRVGLVATLSAVMLAGCSSHAPSAIAPTTVNVSSPDLVKLKSASDIPNCPKVSSAGVKGGMPAVTLPCLGGGRSVDVAGLRGPMIVNFWSSTCTICAQEMPALASFARGQSKVAVLGVDYVDVQPGAALEQATARKVGYPIVADVSGDLDQKAPLPYIRGLPFTAFVDASGRVVGREFGALKSQAEISAAVSKYLGVPG